MPKKTKNRNILDELALRDFGTTEVSAELRGAARRLALKIGCSPKDALTLVENDLKERNLSRLAAKERAKIQKRSKKYAKLCRIEKKKSQIGKPKFNGIVQGGAPGLKSQK